MFIFSFIFQLLLTNFYKKSYLFHDVLRFTASEDFTTIPHLDPTTAVTSTPSGRLLGTVFVIFPWAETPRLIELHSRDRDYTGVSRKYKVQRRFPESNRNSTTHSHFID